MGFSRRHGPIRQLRSTTKDRIGLHVSVSLLEVRELWLLENEGAIQIGLRVPAKYHGHGPRLHDLRHRFATRTLIHWYRAGLDVERELPKLSTYLGHVHVSDTYWYLEAVPELLRLATERLSPREVRP